MTILFKHQKKLYNINKHFIIKTNLMSCKIKYSRIVFKGVIKDCSSKFIKKEAICQKPFILYLYIIKINIKNGVPKGNLYIITSRSKTFH